MRSSERLAVVSGTILTFVKQTMPQIEDKLVKWMTRALANITLFCAINVISMTTLAWHFECHKLKEYMTKRMHSVTGTSFTLFLPPSSLPSVNKGAARPHRFLSTFWTSVPVRDNTATSCAPNLDALLPRVLLPLCARSGDGSWGPWWGTRLD